MITQSTIAEAARRISIGEVVTLVLSGHRKATKYVTPKMTVKATGRHRPRRNARYVEVLVTIGSPNYAERAFIAAAIKAGEPFPVRRVQIRDWKGKR